MSFAFMPVYTGDYLRDTRHLTPQKHGVYLLLLMHCWDQKGPLPLDEQECAGIANCRSADEIESLRYVLTRYFVEMGDGWYNKRMAEEVTRAEFISQKNREAGLKSAAKRRSLARERALNERLTSAGTPTPTPTTTTTTKKPSVSCSVKPNQISLAKEIINFLNEKTGKRFRDTPANIAPIVARLKEGYADRDFRIVIARKVREWGTDEKMMGYLRPKTLFNATNFNQYAADVPEVENG